MVSPSVKLAKSNQSSSVETDYTNTDVSSSSSSSISSSSSMLKCDKKMCFYYIVIVFVLLLICKPKFILEKKTLNDDSKNISISKLILWQLIFCIPLIFYYIINY
jgi:hypothetical protein